MYIVAQSGEPFTYTPPRLLAFWPTVIDAWADMDSYLALSCTLQSIDLLVRLNHVSVSAWSQPCFSFFPEGFIMEKITHHQNTLLALYSSENFLPIKSRSIVDLRRPRSLV